MFRGNYLARRSNLCDRRLHALFGLRSTAVEFETTVASSVAIKATRVMEGVPGVIVFPKVSFKKLKEDLSQDGERISNTEMRVWATHKIVTLSFPEGKSLPSFSSA